MATGTGNLPYNTANVSPFDPILAATTNQHIANINSLADGSGIGDAAIGASKLNFGGSGSGVWWEEIGRTTLGTSASSISVTVPARKYIKVIYATQSTGGTIGSAIRFNGDAGNNYVFSTMDNGGAANGLANQSSIHLAQNLAIQEMGEVNIHNQSNLEKVVDAVAIVVTGTGAGSSPGQRTLMGKWVNTASQATTILLNNQFGTGQYASGSQVIILGHN